jgi:hypothetical protein
MNKYILNFNKFELTESVKYSIVKRFLKVSYQKRYKELFLKYPHDREAYRIYLPYKALKPEEVKVDSIIIESLTDHGYKIVDYLSGICAKEEDIIANRTNRYVKIGKILTKFKETLALNIYANDWQRVILDDSINYEIIISRHPYDIVGMTLGRDWVSCMKPSNPYVKQIINKGFLIAYLVKEGDRNIQKPISRIIIEPQVSTINKKSFAFFLAHSIYGKDIPLFKRRLQDWIDQVNNANQADGLYTHQDAGYNFIDYINAVGALELKKIQNINGSVLPKTHCDLKMFLDGYYHYKIALLMRLNIDNTTTSNIYNNNNGFPVSVKSIHISAKDMEVTLSCSNEWSRYELLEMEAKMPDPYKSVTFEERVKISEKIDPSTLLATS